MRNSGPTNGAGSEASPAVHPFDLLAARSVGRVARITRVHGARGLELAEKTGPGWARRRRRGFTRVELCACLAAGALLVLLALPALANTQSRGQVAQCLNNLRLMGRAVQVWASDYSGQTPWRTPTAAGGTMQVPKAGNAWFEYYSLSNYLGTPRILACPADAGVVVTRDFNQLFSPGFRSAAVSYFLNLHTLAEYPQGLLFGDRNVKFDGFPIGCAVGVNNASFYDPQAGSGQRWTNGVHHMSGNIVLMDGSAWHTSSDKLHEAMMKSPEETGNVHLLRAR